MTREEFSNLKIGDRVVCNFIDEVITIKGYLGVFHMPGRHFSEDVGITDSVEWSKVE